MREVGEGVKIRQERRDRESGGILCNLGSSQNHRNAVSCTFVAQEFNANNYTEGVSLCCVMHLAECVSVYILYILKSS